jgi:hypothetical protein
VISRRKVDLDSLDQMITSGQVMKRGSASRVWEEVGRLGRGFWGALVFFMGFLCGAEGGVEVRIGGGVLFRTGSKGRGALFRTSQKSNRCAFPHRFGEEKVHFSAPFFLGFC